jgi:inorganic pyrophosphatase
MTNLWHDVPRKKVEEFNVIIECQKGSRVKYEVDKETGLVMFDRVLFSPMHYPCDYGFVPQTLWEDGDALDVLVLTHEPLQPGCLIKCKPLGYLEMIDSGEDDIKVLAVPVKDPRFEHINSLDDVAPHLLKEVKHFFTVYKDLQKKKVEVGDWVEKEETLKAIQKSFDLYDKEYPSKE